MADNATVCRQRLLDMNPYEPSDEAIAEMDSSEVPEELREEGKKKVVVIGMSKHAAASHFAERIVERNIVCADDLNYHYRFDGTDEHSRHIPGVRIMRAVIGDELSDMIKE